MMARSTPRAIPKAKHRGVMSVMTNPIRRCPSCPYYSVLIVRATRKPILSHWVTGEIGPR